MFDEEIIMEEDIFILEEIGKLAMKCLKEWQDDRPDMTEVAKQLLKLKKKDGHPDMTEVAKQLLKLKKNTIDAAACHSTEMSYATDATWSVSSSPISEVSRLLPSFQNRSHLNLRKSQSLLSSIKYM
jgi:hypothetical protein